MRSTMKAMVVLAVCMFAVAAFAQNQVGTGSYPASGASQTPAYNNGVIGTPVAGVSKWGTQPTGANALDTTNNNFTAGQQFNSKWGIKGGPHDLTSTNTKVTWSTDGTVNSKNLCYFCHTAHDNTGTTDRTFLWAHPLGTATYTPYSSPTLQSNPTAPVDGNQTAQCLGCHDGTVAVTSGGYGMPVATQTISVNATAITDANNRLLAGSQDIVPLQRTHPVAFSYDPGLAAKHQMRVPASKYSVDGYGIIPLFNPPGSTAGYSFECATCHDPHKNSGVLRRQFPTGASQDAGTGSFCMYCHL